MSKIKLSEVSAMPPANVVKEDIKAETSRLKDRLNELQRVMHAQEKHSILLILQGMDASGKDGTVANVFKGVSPIGIEVKSFKKPTDEEFAHDFLWRVHQKTPQKGMITVFNRSHYEDVLIQRVHNWIDEKRVHQRFKHINAFESLLQEENNTVIIKIFLHVSKEDQLIRLNERRTMEHKHWKHNDNDFTEREHWDKYMAAYEGCFEHCSAIPWHIVPTGKNWYKEYLVTKHVVEALSKLDLKYPPLESDM